MGGHVVMNGNTKKPIGVKIAIAPLDNPGQFQSRPNDYPDGNRMYAFNQTLQDAQAPAHCYDIFPTPKSVTLTGGHTSIGNVVAVKGGKFGDARRFMLDELKKRGVYATGNTSTTITLTADKKLSGEAYEMVVADGKVLITAGSEQGCMNGVKTLISALDHSKANRLENAVVKDGALHLSIDKDSAGKYNYSGGEYRTNDHYSYGYYETSMQAIKNDGVASFAN